MFSSTVCFAVTMETCTAPGLSEISQIRRLTRLSRESGLSNIMESSWTKVNFVLLQKSLDREIPLAQRIRHEPISPRLGPSLSIMSDDLSLIRMYEKLLDHKV